MIAASGTVVERSPGRQIRWGASRRKLCQVVASQLSPILLFLSAKLQVAAHYETGTELLQLCRYLKSFGTVLPLSLIHI